MMRVVEHELRKRSWNLHRSEASPYLRKQWTGSASQSAPSRSLRTLPVVAWWLSPPVCNC